MHFTNSALHPRDSFSSIQRGKEINEEGGGEGACFQRQGAIRKITEAEFEENRWRLTCLQVSRSCLSFSLFN